MAPRSGVARVARREGHRPRARDWCEGRTARPRWRLQMSWVGGSVVRGRGSSCRPGRRNANPPCGAAHPAIHCVRHPCLVRLDGRLLLGVVDTHLEIEGTHLVLLLLAQVLKRRLIREPPRLLSHALLLIECRVLGRSRACRLGARATAGVAVEPLCRVRGTLLPRAALRLHLLHNVLRQRLSEKRAGVVALRMRPRLGLLDPAHHLLDGVDVRRLGAGLAHVGVRSNRCDATRRSWWAGESCKSTPVTRRADEFDLTSSCFAPH